MNVFTDSTWVPASKLGVTGSRFRFCAKAGDLIGFRCTEANPIAYGTFTNKKGKTLVGQVAPEAMDASGVSEDAFKISDRTYAYEAIGLSFQEGRLLVLHDEWTLSEIGFQQTADTQVFANNIIKLFSGNWPNNRFLIYSTNPHLLGSSLEKTITSSKNFVVKGRSNPLDLNTLRTYEAIFVGGEPVDNQMLIDYIKTGGSVCVIAGTGFGGSQAEAAQWNQLLGAFGLRFDSSYNNINGVLPVTNTDHPLFAGVKSLYQNLGQTIHVLPESKASIIMTSGTQGLIAYASVPVASA